MNGNLGYNKNLIPIFKLHGKDIDKARPEVSEAILNKVDLICSQQRNKFQRMIKLQATGPTKPYPYASTIGFTFAAFLVFLAIVYGNSQAEKQLVFVDSPFQFHVYCPISSQQYLKQYVHLIKDANPNLILNANINEDIYAVYVQARENKQVPNSTAGLYYCGLARTWQGTCDDAKIICSSPGPMFYLPVKKPIYIIWINSINTTEISLVEEDCYSPTSDDTFCTIDSRIKTNKSQDLGCAYQDPTFLNYKSNNFRINKSHIPLSPHIHGISNRPIFDGNPLSWFDNNGNLGVGYYSLDSPEYFQQFQNVQSFFEMPFNFINRNIKINYIPNDQPAGNLFYHDHAMRSTKYNVKSGLSGLYILYDPEIESNLPSKDKEKFILISAGNDGDAREHLAPLDSLPPPPPPINHHSKNKRKSEKIYTLNASDIFERNEMYRFRLLNSHFDNRYQGVSFAIYYEKTYDSNNQVVIKEVDPSHISYNLSLNDYRVNFTMIGADSTLFHEYIPDQTTFDFGAAERVEILIKFSEASGVPKEVNNFYLVCDDGNVGGTVIKYRFQLRASSFRNSQKGLPISHYQTSTKNPYTNLSLIPPQKIAVKRFRPLLNLPNEQKFVINGHHMFDMGASQNPQIGTIEDWYLINTLFEAHPIHFHLVNYQVTQTFSLKMVHEDCSLYEVDYLRNSGHPLFEGLNDSQMCDFLKNNITSEEADAIFHHLSNFYLENQTVITQQLGRISGFNVLQKISQAESNIVVDDSCPLGNQYKYICDDQSDSIPLHYKRWKDTALIHPYSVSVLRVRWTMTEYDEKVQAYPYFNIPEDQLMEFPGFVYHCHLLPHEDNEMMRPIMLQSSDTYIKNSVRPVRKSLSNQGYNPLFTTWKDKAYNINKKLGCN